MNKYHYLEIERERFSWPVAKGHYWSKGKVITDFFYGEHKPPFIVPARGGEAMKEPLRNRLLFLEFSGLRTDDQILSFADRYGMLTHGEVIISVGKEYVNAESRAFWLREVWDMQRFVSLYDAIQARDHARLSQLIDYNPRSKGVAVVFPDEEGPVKIMLGELDSADPLARARECLARLINLKMHVYDLEGRTYMAAVPQAYFTPEGKAGSYLEPSTLLSAMWVQALRALVGEVRYRRCEECGLWEDVTEKRSDWKMHSACSNKRRVRKYRERRRLDNGNHP